MIHRLAELGIESIIMRLASAGHEGAVLVQGGTFGGLGWNGAAIDDWLDGFFATGQGANKINKLARAAASERHLVIVLDSFTKAGMGISLGLFAGTIRGPADYAVPSMNPPTPLSHLWLLRTVTWEALRWTRTGGWVVVPPG